MAIQSTSSSCSSSPPMKIHICYVILHRKIQLEWEPANDTECDFLRTMSYLTFARAAGLLGGLIGIGGGGGGGMIVVLPSVWEGLGM